MSRLHAKIAIVGGGIFGVTAAIKLAQKNLSVDLFERNGDILQEASGIKQEAKTRFLQL